jgi:glycosyltransferase involved in cell wall biosynthesis
MQFTLVSTVFNEAKRISKTIADIQAQTFQPSEIVITDAGSTDGTWEMLQEWQKTGIVPIVLLQERGCNVARGRNIAIAKATNEIIVSTDFGCRFHPFWLESLTMPFQTSDNKHRTTIEVVGGAFTVLEDEIQSNAAKSDYILQRGYPVVLDEYFSLSSRSIAYYKKVWEKVGGYPEWLTLAADDTIFWMLVKKHGFNFQLVNKPYVFWGRHKTNKAFAREAFRYGLGDGESRINYRNFWSNIIETCLRYCLVISILFSTLILVTGHWSLSIFFIPILFLPGLRSYKNAFKNWQKVKSEKYNFKIFLYALWQLELSRVYYLRGYLKGLSDNDLIKKEGRRKLKIALGT